MKLKRFEALSLQEALRAVKAEMGPDAVILSTRRIHKGGRFFGLLSQPFVEVTAAVDQTKTQEKPRLPYVRQSREDHERAATTEEATVNGAEVERGQSFEDQLRIATMLDPLTQQLTALREEFMQLRQERENPETVVGPLRQELEGLRIVVGEALGDRMRRRVEALPGDLAEEYETLIAEGVQPQLAHDFVRSTAETLGTTGLSNSQAVKELLWEKMEDSITVSGSCLPTGNMQKIVMLVGPTGVGKTTTIAKLASWATKG